MLVQEFSHDYICKQQEYLVIKDIFVAREKQLLYNKYIITFIHCYALIVATVELFY